MARKARGGRDDAQPAETPTGRRTYRLHLAGASLLAVLIAWHRFATVMPQPGGPFDDPDAMFHAHRVVRAIEEGRWLPAVFDPYENFPAGGRALWPPLHDATLALIARIGGSTAAAPRRGLPLVAGFPVVELVLALLAAAALGKRAGGPRGGAAAAWLFALTPCLGRRGAFGEIDHNVTEILGALLLLLLADTIARRETTGGHGLRDPRLSPLLWAAAVLIALGFYTGLVFSAGFVAAAVAARDLAARGGRALARISLGFGLAALLLPFFASLRVSPDPSDPWRLGPPYVLVLAIGAAGTGFFALAVAVRRGFSKDPDLFAAAGISAGVFAMLVTSPRAWPALVQGFGFLGSRDPWLATISEFRPLFENAGWAGMGLPAVAVAIAAPALIVSFRSLRPLAATPEFGVLAVPFLILIAVTLSQSRFLPMTAAFGAAAGGAAWSLLRPRPAARRAMWAVAAAGLVPAALLYLFPFLGATIRGSPLAEVLVWDTAAEAIRVATPDPGNPPAWGVLAPWDFGHGIIFRASRAVALDNFGGMQPGFTAAQEIWFEPSPARAVRELDRMRIRYVLVVWPPYFLPSVAASLGLNPNGYFEGEWSPRTKPAYRPTPAGERALATRLHLRDAAPLPADGAEDRAALSRFRLLWYSDLADVGPKGPFPVQKLFELLPEGAPR